MLPVLTAMYAHTFHNVIGPGFRNVKRAACLMSLQNCWHSPPFTWHMQCTDAELQASVCNSTMGSELGPVPGLAWRSVPDNEALACLTLRACAYVVHMFLLTMQLVVVQPQAELWLQELLSNV